MNALPRWRVAGLFPLLFAAANMSLERTATLAAIYPATWSLSQLGTGALSDRIGRKWLIAAGMWTQAVGIAITAGAGTFAWFAAGAVFRGVGTAMVYATLLAGTGDVAAPAGARPTESRAFCRTSTRRSTSLCEERDPC